jgi:hypothetical protein
MTKSEGDERTAYLTRMEGAVDRAYAHQDRQTNKYGLVETPSDKFYDHNERDSDHAYALEDGNLIACQEGMPKMYLSTNSINLEAKLFYAWMKTQLGKPDETREAVDSYKKGIQNYRELFWVDEQAYPTPLLYGDFSQKKNIQKADFISDEALDGIFYGHWTPDQSSAVVRRIKRPDMETPWGQRTRSRDSAQYYENGPKAYWNGPLWLHRIGIAAESFAMSGHPKEAGTKAYQFKALVFNRGISELEVFTDTRKLAYYDEGQGRIFGLPQLFGVGSALMITAAKLEDPQRLDLSPEALTQGAQSSRLFQAA